MLTDCNEEVSEKKASQLPVPHTVAQGDADAALRALEKVGSERIAVAAAMAAQTSDEIEKRKIMNMQEKLQNCMDSIRTNLERATNVIPDDDYEAQFRRSAQVDVVWGLYDVDNQEATSSSELEEDTDYDSDMEEGLFLDREALARVKDLRAKVRQTSERIGKLRHEIPKQTAQLIQSEMELVENFRNEAQKTPTKNLLSALANAEENDTINNSGGMTLGHANNAPICNAVSMDSATTEAMRDMEDSFQKLNTLLETVRGKLPEELDSFLSTMEAVETYVKKVTNAENLNEHGEYVPLNPVERAMFSPDARRHSSFDSEIDAAPNKCLSSPQSRFLMYLNN